MTGMHFEFPDELVEEIADRVAVKIVKQQPAGPGGWLTAQQAAEHMACTVERIYELKHQKKIPAHQDGRRPLFKRDDLDAYIEGRP